LAGVVPLVGVTESQAAFVTDTVNASGAPLLLTWMVCAAGAGSPVRYEKPALVEFSARTGGDVTFAVTVIVCGLLVAPAAAIVIVPVWLPWLSKDVFSETFNVLGVFPEAGLKLIQLAVVVAV